LATRGRRDLICALFRCAPDQSPPVFAKIPTMKMGPVSVHRHRPYSLDGHRLSSLYRVTLLPRTISLLKYSGRAREGWPSRMVHSNAELKSSRPHVDLPLTGGVPKSVSRAPWTDTLASFSESLWTRLYSSILIISVTIAYTIFPPGGSWPKVPALRFQDGCRALCRKGE
jgi:hypothetical protein